MNKFRPFLSAFVGTAGCVCLAAIPLSVCAQQAAEESSVRPTVKPVVDPASAPASAAPAPSDAAPTPASNDDSDDKAGDDKTKETTETDITATEGASFNSKDRVAVFTGNVKVVDPRFQLVCDRLTVFLNKPVPAGQNPPATPTPPPLATPAPTGKKKKGGAGADPAAPTGGSGIDHAVAEGHVIILQKKAPTKPGEEEKVSVGRGERGTFDNKTGDMVLSGWPSLEQNGSSLVASAESTVMTIHRDSSLDTKGPSKTKLIQKKGANSSGSVFDIPTAPSGGGGRNRNNGAASAATPALTRPSGR